MSLYLIEWTSLNPKVSSSMFASGALGAKPAKGEDEDESIIPANVKILQSVHVVGEPRGYVLVDASGDEVQQIVLALPPETFELDVMPVINDADTQKVMAKRHSEYKLK